MFDDEDHAANCTLLSRFILRLLTSDLCVVKFACVCVDVDVCALSISGSI